MPDGHDYQLVNDLSRHTGWAHAPAIAYAEYGIGLFAVLALAAYVWASWRRDARALVGAGWAGVAGLVAVAVNQLSVHLLHEARPYAVMPHALVLVARSSDPSAPSAHAVVVAAVATGLLLVHRRLGLLAWALALVMAFDRVDVGAHYPTDVLLGLEEGTAIALAGWYVARPVLDRVRQTVAHTPLAAVLQRPGHVVAADGRDPTPTHPPVRDG